MITIKDFADKWKISTQAVYKQLQTHEAELEGHIHKVKGSNARWLDDQAVEILERIREVNPVVVERDTSAERIAELEREVNYWKDEYYSKVSENAALQTKITENAAAIATSSMQLQLLEEKKNHEIDVLQASVDLQIREAEDKVKMEMQTKYNQDLAALQEKLDQERAKKWWQKLFGQ